MITPNHSTHITLSFILVLAMHTQIDMSTDVANAKKTLPVTLIEGLTHMQFASGEVPKNVQKKDLIPEISIVEAHAKIAADVVAFAAMGILSDEWDVLNARMTQSAALAAPMIEAFKQEGYHEFLPPCYCEAVDE